MSKVWQSEFGRCKKRFEELAARYQPVTAVVIQIMQEPAPHIITDVFGLSGPAGPQLFYAANAVKGKSRHLHLFGHDQAVRDPLIAAATEAWTTSLGAGFESAKSIEPPYTFEGATGHLWVHLLFEMLWSSQLPGRAPLEKYIDVELDGHRYVVPLDDGYEPTSGPGNDEGWNRVLKLTPRPANWFHSQIHDLAGVSAAALDWMLIGGTFNESRLNTVKRTRDLRSQLPEGQQRRGRLTEEDSKAKRAHLLAKVREHPTLKGDLAELAHLVGVSESTARRWLDKEEQKLWEIERRKT